METFSGNNNNADEKIFTLQKCVSKMDKLFHKSEREYLKQIEKLKQDLEKRDKITQVDFHSILFPNRRSFSPQGNILCSLYILFL